MATAWPIGRGGEDEFFPAKRKNAPANRGVAGTSRSKFAELYDPFGLISV